MTEIASSYTVTVHDEPDGSHWAEIDELPGCFASGDTDEELRDNIAEALSLYLSTDDHPVQVTTGRFTKIPQESVRRYLVTT